MTGFLIGLLVGGMIGVFAMALMNAASKEDEWMESYRTSKE